MADEEKTEEEKNSNEAEARQEEETQDELENDELETPESGDESEEAESEEDPAEARRRAAQAAVAAVKARKKKKTGRKHKKPSETAGERLAAQKDAKAEKKAEEREAAAARAAEEEAAREAGNVEEELEPDELETAAVSFLEKHQKTILYGMGAITLIGLVALGIQYIRTEANSPAAAQLWDGLNTLSQPVGLSPFGDEEDNFESFSERAEAAIEELSGAQSDLGNSPAGHMASLAVAQANYDLGNFEEAKGAYQSALEASDDPFVQARALEGLAYVAEAGGDWDEARANYERLKELTDSLETSALADYHLARILEEEGNDEEAVEAYVAVLDAINEADDGVDLSYVRNQTELHLGALDSSRVPARGLSIEDQLRLQEQLQNLR